MASGSSRQGLLVGGIAMLSLVLVAILGALLLGRQASDTGNEAAAGPSAPVVEPTAGGASTTAAPSASGDPVRCWNGQAAAAYNACARLRGASAMRWLFPTLERDLSSCVPASAYDGKIRAFECMVSLGGYSARVVYSEWGSFQLGDDHYREKYGAPDRRDGQFSVWTTEKRAKNYQTSRMFASKLPFSMTVAASSEEAASEVMRNLPFRGSAQTDLYR